MTAYSSQKLSKKALSAKVTKQKPRDVPSGCFLISTFVTCPNLAKCAATLSSLEKARNALQRSERAAEIEAEPAFQRSLARLDRALPKATDKDRVLPTLPHEAHLICTRVELSHCPAVGSFKRGPVLVTCTENGHDTSRYMPKKSFTPWNLALLSFQCSFSGYCSDSC